MDEDDEPDETCESCGGTGEEGELGLDEEGICAECQQAAEGDRQLESDYRFWCR